MDRTIKRVLVANRGEIAVRIIRAAKDVGITSVAVYADSDSEGLFVKLADEAFALNGVTPAQTYLDVDKILDVARRAEVDAIHPGHGFLSENADFAQAVIDAGFLWIGPPPHAIRVLGDKVQARHIAQKVGAPLVPGTADPVDDPEEVVQFAKEHGLPLAIKAAFGGGGRGLKVAHSTNQLFVKPSPRSDVGNVSSSATWTSRVTSRPSASPTTTVPCRSSLPATAPCNVVTRSSSRRPRHLSSVTSN